MLRAAPIVLAACLAGCGGGSPGHRAAARADSDPCAPAKQRPHTIVALPSARRPAPLLIAFHGLTDSARGFSSETDLTTLGPRRGVIVAFLDADRNHRWELDDRDGHADVDHTRSLIDDLVKSGCAEPKHVYLTGFSNGGGFTARAACALAGRVAAAVPVAGSYTSVQPCPRRGPHVALLEIHGTRDPWYPTVGRLLGWWRRRDGCPPKPAVAHPRRGVTRVRWAGCDVERISLAGTGHAWFGEFVVSGNDPTGLKASRAVLDFALQH